MRVLPVQSAGRSRRHYASCTTPRAWCFTIELLSYATETKLGITWPQKGITSRSGRTRHFDSTQPITLELSANSNLSPNLNPEVVAEANLRIARKSTHNGQSDKLTQICGLPVARPRGCWSGDWDSIHPYRRHHELVTSQVRLQLSLKVVLRLQFPADSHVSGVIVRRAI